MRHIIEVHEYPVITTNSPKSLSVCGFIKSQALLTWLALRMIIIPWFDHQMEHFSCNLEVQSKDFFPYVKITCPPVEKG